MTRILGSILAGGLLVLACAHGAAAPDDALMRDHVFSAPMDDVWSQAQRLLESQGYVLVPSSGTYRVETEWRLIGGRKPRLVDGGSSEVVPVRDKTGEWSSAPPPPPGMGGPRRTQPGASVRQDEEEKVVVEGEALEEGRSRVHFYRVHRSDPEPRFAADLERALEARMMNAAVR